MVAGKPTFGTAISAGVIYHIQEEVPEAILAALLIKCTTDGYNLLRGRSHCCCKLSCIVCCLLLLLRSTKEIWRLILLLTLLLWLLGCTKQAELLLILLLWLLRCAKNAWLALLLTKPTAEKRSWSLTGNIFIVLPWKLCNPEAVLDDFESACAKRKPTLQTKVCLIQRQVCLTGQTGRLQKWRRQRDCLQS